ncbi:hypothetical protein FV767_18040 [Vibrio parahaemolyticus]|nr:hypothetical protein [Vibrio parahaemolyticus]
MTKSFKVSCIISFSILVFSDYFISFSTSNKSIVGPLLIAQGVMSVVPFVLLIIYKLKKINKIPKKIKFYYFWVLAMVIYTVVAMIVGISAENSYRYILGDAFRFVIPVFVVAGFILSTPSIYKEKQFNDAFEGLFKLAVFYNFLMLFAKVLLVFNGSFYGGGANQYFIHHFLLIVMFFSIISHGELGFLARPLSKKVIYSVFVLCGIIFTILSFKREFWFLLILTLFFILFLSISNKRSLLLFSAIISSILIYVVNSPDLVELIYNRFMYTFNGSGGNGIDKSSFERISEIKGAIATMHNDFPVGEVFFGRGAGAEFTLVEYFGSVKESTGSKLGYYHHIHNMFVVIYFRFGLIGLALYFLPFLYGMFFYFLNKRFLSISQSVVLLACNIQLLIMIISGLAANSMYGSVYFGFVLSVMVLVTLYSRGKSEKDFSKCGFC